MRSRLIGQRTAVINQIRGFLLEHGIAVRQGLRFLRQQLPDILAKRSDVLSPRMIRIMEDLSGDWRRLDERIEHITKEIEVLAGTDVNCGQLMLFRASARSLPAPRSRRSAMELPLQEGETLPRGLA